MTPNNHECQTGKCHPTQQTMQKPTQTMQEPPDTVVRESWKREFKDFLIELGFSSIYLTEKNETRIADWWIEKTSLAQSEGYRRGVEDGKKEMEEKAQFEKDFAVSDATSKLQ